MHVLMLSTDRTILNVGSPARARMEEYARSLGRLSVIVCCRGWEKRVIGEPLSIYPTNSLSKFFYGSDALRIARRIEKANVVSAQDPFEIGRAGVRIADALKIPLHVQIHTDFTVPEFKTAHWPLNAIRMRLAPYVLARAKKIRSVSERIKEHVVALYHPAAPISVLPIFVDLELFQNLPRTHHPKFKIMLLVVSRLEKEKRIDRTIAALKKARDAGLECGLTIVGSGSEADSLKHQARQLGISEWVEFTGFQNNLVPYYAMADALLYPGAPYEGYGMAIVEALSAGVPVLAEDVGIAREAGTEIVQGDFGDSLVAFLKSPPRKVQLLYQPYASKEEYLRKFSEDLTV